MECTTKMIFNQEDGLGVIFSCPSCGIKVMTHFLHQGKSIIHVRDGRGGGDFIALSSGYCDCGKIVETGKHKGWLAITGLTIDQMFYREELPDWVEIID